MKKRCNTNQPIPDCKQTLRKTLREQRRQQTISQQNDAALKLSHHLIESTLYKNSQHIACYLANEGEISAEFIISALSNDPDKRCYLPLLHPNEEKSLCFIAYREGDPLKLNRYGIPEPHFDENNILPSEQLDLVLLPLVAFDKQGNRLGMGAGYYDRTFSFCREKASGSKPLLFGLGYQFQEVGSVPAESWDIPLDGIVTEAGNALKDSVT